MYSAFGTDPEKHVFGVLKWLGPSSWKIRAPLFRIVGAVVAYAIATQGTIVFLPSYPGIVSNGVKLKFYYIPQRQVSFMRTV